MSETDTWIETALAEPAIASLRRAGAPVVAIASAPTRVVYANAQARALFGGDLDRLTRRLVHGSEPGSSRIVALAHALLPGAAPRLERLRFFFGPIAETVTVLCQRAAVADGAPVFVMAALGVRGPAAAAPANVEPLAALQPPGPQPAEAACAPARAHRFTWRTDATGRFVHVDPALAAVVGAANAAEIGQSFADLASALDSSGALGDALAGAITWSGVEVVWPTGGGEGAPTVLGGAATFDADGAFGGYRGFGVVAAARVARAPIAFPLRAAPASMIVEEESQEAQALDSDIGPIDLAPATAASAPDDLVAALAAAGVEQQPEAFETSAPEVFDTASEPAETSQPEARAEPAQRVAPEAASETVAPPANIVPLRPARAPEPPAEPRRAVAPPLSAGEQQAFHDIARALGAEPARLPQQSVPMTSEEGAEADRMDARASRAPVVAPSEGDADDEAAAVARNARAMLDRMPVGVLVSRQNVTIFANRTLLDLLDFPDADAFHEAGGLDLLFRGRAPEAGVAEIQTRSGEPLAVDARLQSIEWDGLPATLVSLRRAQENGDGQRVRALELDLRQRDAEARELHAILDTATDGVAVVDSQGRILSLNRSGQALFGCDGADVAGRHLNTLVDRESQAVVADYFDGVKAGGVASVLNDGREILARAQKGGAIPVFMTMGRLSAGPQAKFCVVLRDLTSWKRAERELGDARREAERASALKSDFLAKISHEIRTPLNAILGFTEVIIDERFGPVGNERYRDYLRDIHKSGEHVMSLVNDLLDLSKIEAGKMEMDFQSVDANAVVTECVSLMQPQANRERVVVRMSLAHKLPNIVADERSLRQIVLNLLSNAVKFNEPGGQVIVSTALTDAGHAVVRIKDTGVGMSETEMETALEPFRQVATSRRADGTGLGLPLTKALVEANRASFVIKSRKAEGTLVEVIFPPTRVLAE